MLNGLPIKLPRFHGIFDCRLSMLWVIAAFVAQSFALNIDTVIIGNGGPGPYPLGKSFIETQTIRIVPADTAKKQAPAFTFIDELNAVLFAAPIDSACVMNVHFRTSYFGLPRVYSLYDKSYIGPHDSLLRGKDTVFHATMPSFAEENLTLSGFKSVGISMNNQGSMNLEQAVDVTLSGEIAPHTTLSGHLTDQGSSLEGSTREVSDLDMVYVSLDNPHYNALIGDQYVEWPAGGMLQGRKKAKGLSAGISLPGISVKAFGALTGGNFTVQTITGKNGLQGPYTLTGNEESGNIMPIQGTVKVSIGGTKCEEGADQDFTVDYDLGSITFTPKILIRDETIIKVEYEYRVFNYQRTFTGMSMRAATPDSSVTVSGALWYEADDKNQPLDMQLSDTDQALLATQTDTSKLRFSGRLIDPKDVAWESSQLALYTVDSLKHYRYTPYDPQNPTNTQGFYYVAFQNTGPGAGDYDLDSASMKTAPGLGAIYRYVGTGNGSAVLPPIPLPQSTMNGEIITKAKFTPWASAALDVAGTDQNHNLFSSTGAQDVRGAATRTSLLLGAKRTDRPGLWFSADHSLITPNMSGDVAPAFDRNQQWDDTTGATLFGSRQSWETTGGLTLRGNTMTEMNYGQYYNDDRIVTDRIQNSTRIGLQKHLFLDYSGAFFRHWTDSGIDKTRRDDGHLNFISDRLEGSLEYKDEWRELIDALNHGSAGPGVSLQVKPLSLHESLFYSVFRRGNGGLLSAADTGHSLLWDEEFSRTFSPNWKTSMSSHYLTQDVFGQGKTSSILVTALNDLSVPGRGFTTHESYQVNIERAATFVQVPVPVGKGLGDYVWNDTLKEYVPGKNGDYTIQEQQVYGSTSDSRVRKTVLNLTWSLNHSHKRRLRGILGDLDFNGALNTNEQLGIDQPLPTSSWVPGFGSLFDKNAANDSLVRFADLSYRQNLEWNPDSIPGVHGKLYIQPSYKKIRDYSESGVEYGGGADRTIKDWFLGFEGSIVSVTRQSVDSAAENNYEVIDRHVMLTEKRKVYHDFSAYIKETGGFASKTSIVEDDQGFYYRIVPGVLWQPSQKGLAELSYTYSSVNIPGTLDYRMAQGFASGISQTVELNAHINFGTHFTTDVTYKGLFGAGAASKSGLHTVSMQMKAFL